MGSFHLRAYKPTNKKQLIIYVVWVKGVNGKGGSIKLSTGYSVLPGQWSKKKREVLGGQHPKAREVNSSLKDFANQVDEIVHEAKQQGHLISSEYIRMKLDPVKPVQLPLFPAFVAYLEANEGRVTPSTTRNRRGCLFKLQAFQEAERYPLAFNTIDISFYRRFETFLISQEGLADSTVARHTKSLRSFMTWAFEMGYHRSLEFKQFSHKSPRVDSYFALEKEEVKALADLDLADNPRLARVRDKFLFMCDTAMRHGDVEALKRQSIVQTSIEGETFFTLKYQQKKTRRFGVAVNTILTDEPSLNRYPLSIALRYMGQNRPDDLVFQPITNQKFNDYLKELAKLADLTRLVPVPQRKGCNRPEIAPIYQVLTTHAARRTFITLRAEQGWSERQITVFSGHLSTDELRTYTKRTPKFLHHLARQALVIEPAQVSTDHA